MFLSSLKWHPPRTLLKVSLFFSLLLSLVVAPRASLADDQYILYRVQSGDTLYELAQRYAASPDAMRYFQRENGISNARRLQIGQELALSKKWLRYRPATLKVVSFTGPVRLLVDGRAVTPRLNGDVVEGTEIRTGPAGFISIGGGRGALLTVPSSSRLRIGEARVYALNETLDVDLKVLQGRASFRPAKMRDGETYRVRTPVAVAAVRGTEFRIGFDEDRGIGLVEVTEGSVNFGNESDEASLTPGWGMYTAAKSGLTAEKLLPAPNFDSPGRVQTDETLTFAIEPDSEVLGYRIQVARDAGFVEMMAEEVSPAPTITLPGMENGNYFVRARAIAPSGIEGLSESYSFRRQRVGVSAEAAVSPIENGFKFAWIHVGEGAPSFDFKLYRQGEADTPVIHELGLTNSSLTLTNLAPGTYFWSVGVSEGEGVERVSVEGKPQKLVIAH